MSVIALRKCQANFVLYRMTWGANDFAIQEFCPVKHTWEIRWVISGYPSQRSLSVHCALFLVGNPFVPMLVNSGAHARQPVAVFGLFQQFHSGEELDAVGGRIARRPFFLNLSRAMIGGSNSRTVRVPARKWGCNLAKDHSLPVTHRNENHNDHSM
jgi:hypothetical protein